MNVLPSLFQFGLKPLHSGITHHEMFKLLGVFCYLCLSACCPVSFTQSLPVLLRCVCDEEACFLRSSDHLISCCLLSVLFPRALIVLNEGALVTGAMNILDQRNWMQIYFRVRMHSWWFPCYFFTEAALKNLSLNALVSMFSNEL